MNRSRVPPNSTRAVSVPAIYYAVVAAIEQQRKRYNVPMSKLDDGAGVTSGHYAKALYADAPTGRMVSWSTLQLFIETLFPEGFSVTIKEARNKCLDAGKHRLSIRFDGARYDFEARADWMVELSRRGSSKGGRARAEKLSPRRRKQIAKQAARKRWIAKRGTAIAATIEAAAE